MYENITEVKEIYAGMDQRDSIKTQTEVNKLLSEGWILLQIDQRGSEYGGEGTRSSFYILGKPHQP